MGCEHLCRKFGMKLRQEKTSFVDPSANIIPSADVLHFGEKLLDQGHTEDPGHLATRLE